MDMPCPSCGQHVCSACWPSHFCHGPASTGSWSSGSEVASPDAEAASLSGLASSCEDGFGFLHGLMPDHGASDMKLYRQNMFCELEACSDLNGLRIGSPGKRQLFGHNPCDYAKLSSLLSWDIPSGCVVIHLTKKKALVCQPNQIPSASTLEYALSWVRQHSGLCICVENLPEQMGATHVKSDGLRFAFLSVYWLPGQTKAFTPGARSDLVLRAISPWTCSSARK